MLINHGNPFTYYKKVKDGEIIKLKISWLPFNENSVYKNEEFTSFDNNTKNNKIDKNLNNNSISDINKKNNISVSDNSKKDNNNPQKEKNNSIFKKIFRQ